LGLFDFFRKKSDEELFAEAVKNQDFMTVVKLGKSILEKKPDQISVLNPYVDALVKLGRKDEAVSTLISFAERKLEEEYYDVAIPVLKKALRIDPLNLKAIKLLTNAFKRKELYYDAFNVLLDAFQKMEETGINTSTLKEMIENFLKDTSHPVFYEKYGDVLFEKGDKENALVNFILAGNMYINLRNYPAALRSFLKARRIKTTEALDKHLIETISYMENPKVQSILLTLLQEHKDDFNFLTFIVSQFKETGRLDFLKSLVSNVPLPKVKYTLLALINYELGEVEEAQEYLNKIQLIDRNLYERIVAYLKTIKPEEELSLPVEASKEEELPEPEQILEVLDQVLDINELVNDFITSREEEPPKKIKEEVLTLKKNRDGRRLISAAEALMGIGNLKKAEEEAREALNTECRPKAAVLLAEIMKQQNREKEALAFLIDELKRRDYTEEDRAKLKVKLGEIYQSMGDREKALSWYREAQKVLKDEALQEKIEELEKETV